MAKAKLVEVNEKIAEKVVGGYKKIEEGAVGGFNKIADKFVDNFLTKEGETVEEAKIRLKEEQQMRDALGQEGKAAVNNDIVEENMRQTMEIVEQAKRNAGIVK